MYARIRMCTGHEEGFSAGMNSVPLELHDLTAYSTCSLEHVAMSPNTLEQTAGLQPSLSYNSMHLHPLPLPVLLLPCRRCESGFEELSPKHEALKYVG